MVIVADADRDSRSNLRVALEHAGLDVLAASDRRQAIRHAHAPPGSVMVLDMSLAGANGRETLGQLRADPGLESLPVILLTGPMTEADRIASLDGGAIDVLTKPIAGAEVAARVRARMRSDAALRREHELGRESRRRLAAYLPGLPRDASLRNLATLLTDGLGQIVGVETVAILAFERGSARSIAAVGALSARFPAPKLLNQEVGSEISRRAATGAWLDMPLGPRRASHDALELAFVPFSLGPAEAPIGCLVYGRRSDPVLGPLSHRLADLIDATDLIVTVLRPAIEHAETTSTAILGLRRLISRRSFEILLQPIARLDTGAVIAVEALTRFPDGFRPQVKFAEAAALGMGAALQRATVAEAVKAASSLPRDVALSVNISPDVLEHDAELPHLFAGAGRPMIVELTEHERIDDYDAVRAAFARLGPGVRLAVDDAGSGYATLRHIFSLRPAYVKLDIEWVRGIDADPIRRSMVSGLTHFASETACELIAEGIEEEDERQALLELGVKLGQGFLVGRPAAAAAMSRIGGVSTV